jgi:hypothetical protein
MKIINIHTRIINQPKAKVAELFSTLSSENDMMLATDKWSPMILDSGLNVGSRGGHGGIKYTVQDYKPDKSITFQFDLKGFDGFHKFEISEINIRATELKHSVQMNTTGLGILKWALAIRFLHDAYIEDAFDKVENHFTNEKKISKWTIWVRILRKIMKPKKK